MAEKLLDFSQPFDVPLLDATVAAFYGTGSKDEVSRSFPSPSPSLLLYSRFVAVSCLESLHSLQFHSGSDSFLSLSLFCSASKCVTLPSPFCFFVDAMWEIFSSFARLWKGRLLWSHRVQYGGKRKFLSLMQMILALNLEGKMKVLSWMLFQRSGKRKMLNLTLQVW